MDTDIYYYEYIKEEMYKRRDQVLTKLSSIVHPAYVDDFAKMLHLSWLEDLHEAHTIAESFDLDPIDFVAIAKDMKEFEELLMKEKEQMYVGDYA